MRLSNAMASFIKFWILSIVFSASILTQAARSTPRSIKIGGVFEEQSLEMVMRYAVNRVNQRRDLLPITALSAEVSLTPEADSFTAGRRVCSLLERGVVAIFGPVSTLSSAHAQSICNHVAIPHLETRWLSGQDPQQYAASLYPDAESLSLAYFHFMRRNGWEAFTILYDPNEGLLKLQKLLTLASDASITVTLRELKPVYSLNHGADYRPILKDIKNSRETKIILHADLNKVGTVLHQALTIRMMTSSYAYLVTHLDIGLLDLQDYQHDGVNITGFQLVANSNPLVTEVTSDWVYQDITTGKSPLAGRNGIATQAALLYDAIFVFAKAFHMYASQANDVTIPNNLSCDSDVKWPDGDGLMNVLSMTEMQGLTGRLKFDQSGKRTDYTLDLVELTNEGLVKTGYWTAKTGLNITHTIKEQETKALLKNSTLIVTTILEDPYVMYKNRSDALYHEGNDRFESYCVDLLHEISSILGFNYTVKLVDDGQYGAPSGENGEWTGMVRELMDRRADIAVASLTISYVREQVIDFTKPFMNLGISILYKRPEKQNPELFSFLSPLSFTVWAYVVAAYLVVSMALFVLARFSPYEWTNPHPCNEDSELVENQFSLLNSLWFTIGSFMQQGCDIMPKAPSTRLVSTLWWFFTLIIISSYTANLAAFLTVERMTIDIENADDLSRQTAIQYGSVYGGSTMTFFKTSSIDTYKRMWNFMSTTQPSPFVNSTPEGIARVLKGNYAYLLESTMNEYVTRRNCDLMQVGGLLDSKGYGIGTPQGSPYRDSFSDAILKLQESQKLQLLYNKWWKEKGVAASCDAEENKGQQSALGIANVGGVFVVLIGGLVLSIFMALVEFTWNARRNATEDRQSVCSEMMEELRFAVCRCHKDTKTLKKASSLKQGPPSSELIDEPNGPLTPLTAKYKEINAVNHRLHYGLPDNIQGGYT